MDFLKTFKIEDFRCRFALEGISEVVMAATRSQPSSERVPGTRQGYKLILSMLSVWKLVEKATQYFDPYCPTIYFWMCLKIFESISNDA